MARLMHLHAITHPERVAQRFGVSANYVRQLWRTMDVQDMAMTHEILCDVAPIGEVMEFLK